MSKAKQVQAAVKYIDSWLELNFKNARIPSLSVAVQSGDKIIYSQALGYSNVQQKQPATPQTKYRVASHSKTFTATAIMQLQEAGKLQLDDQVSKYLVWFKSSKDKRVAKLTIRQVLNHTAGLIRDGEDADYWQQQRPFPDEAELKDYIKSAKLIYAADEQFKYSNFGFSYLGLLIEAITATSYAAYIKEHITKPRGLKDTGADIDESTTDLAIPYSMQLNQKPRQPLEHSSTNAMAAATGFYSTAKDMCCYFAGHFFGNTTLLSDASKKTMHHDYWSVDQSKQKYGLGIITWKQKKGWIWRGHSGGFPGFTSCSAFEANKGLAVSVLVNARGVPIYRIMDGIVSILEAFLSAKGTPDPQVAKFTGRFYSTWDVTDIVQVGNKLLGVSALGWTPIDKTAKEFEVLNKNTLRITKSDGFSSPGELVKYTFQNNQIETIRLAGSSLLTELQAKKKGWL